MSTTPHTPQRLHISRVAPQSQSEIIAESRSIVVSALYAAGYSPRDVTMYLAGASMLGQLQPGGCAWGLVHLVRMHFASPLMPDDQTIERAGAHDQPTDIHHDPYDQ